MKITNPKFCTFFSIALFFLFSFVNAQNTSLTKAQEYISIKGEVTFSFQVSSREALEPISQQMSIVNFNPETNMVKVWANEQQFEEFLSQNIPFEITELDNEARDVVMSSSFANRANTLTFPIAAYPTYADYAQQMQDFVNDNPTICQLVDIGATGEGAGGGNKRLLFIKLSDNVTTQEQEPKLMYTSSMHGDEIAGFPMMLDLINYFITAYNDINHSDHTRVQNLINNSEVWINPMANPDGTYYNNASNTSVANARRGNVNGLDLNRNYPDNVGGAHPDGNAYQTETLAFMNLADSNHFVVSANFHGGIEVVNYPWDNTLDRHPDDAWWILATREYADNAQANSPAGYMTALNNGITHGADWYQVEGGRQDYMNFYKQAKEVTIELSDVKTPPANQLVNHWNYNKEALIEFLIQGTYGFRGVVKDAVSGNPIEATVKIVGHDALGSHTITELPFGDYYRPMKAGTYDIIFEAPCYQSVTLTNQTITDYQTLTLADVLLTPNASVAPTGLTTSNISSFSVDLDWDLSSVDNYDIRYKEIADANWTVVTGIATNSYQITGLTALTDYEVQVRSNCLSIASPYSASVNFSTIDVVSCTGSSISVFPYSESFETDLGLWSQEATDDFDWTRKLEEADGNSTPSTGTGPSLAANQDYFLYTEASNPNFPSKNAQLISPCLDFTGHENALFSFDYHMFGANVGVLTIDVSVDNGAFYTTLNTYTLSGSQHTSHIDPWKTQAVDLSAYNGQSIKLRFSVTTDSNASNGWSGDISIDNFGITATLTDTEDPTAPTNLISVNTTETTTDLSWTASTDNVGVTEYEVYQEGVLITTVVGITYQVTGLTASTSYNFYVIAKDAAGNSSAQSNTENVTTLDPPDTEDPTAPTNLISANTTETTTDLSWTASTDNVGVTEYEVYQNGLLIATVVGTTYQVIGLSAGTAYSFYVIAKDAVGNTSPQSNIENVTTLDLQPPTAPTNLTSSNTTQTTTDLSWTSSTDNVGVTEYEVYLDGLLIANIAGITYQATALSAGTTYNFHVIAKDAAGNSSTQSNTETVITLDPLDTEVPTAPTNLVAANTTETTTDLSWTASTDNVGVTEYEVYQDGALIATVVGTSYQVTGLSAGTAYSFYVIAKDAAGNSSAQSNTENITTLDNQSPTAPTNLVAASTTETTTDLSWTASTDNVGVTEYEVYQDAVLITTVAGITYQVTGLTASTSYNFYVIAKDAAGNSSAQSNTENVTTLDPPDTEDPTAPTNLVAANTTETTTDLSWTASTDNVGVTEYEVYQDGALIATVVGTSYQVTGLTDNTSYSFFIIALDAARNSSAQSNTVNITTLISPDTEDPTAPTNLIVSNTTETTTDLAWTASTDNIGVTEYEVYQDGILISTVVGITYQVTGLTASTSYNFYVIAKDAAGNSSAQSNTENVTTLDPPDTEAPTAPTNLIANNTTVTTTDLSWTGSTDNIAVTEYEVYQDGILIATIAGITYQVTGLSANTTYTFTVFAKDAAGNTSAPSNTLDVLTQESNNNYCTSTSNNSTEEYISRVQLNTIDNSSNAQDYTDFTSISTILRENTQYTISITPTWQGTVYNEAFSVWIDYNKNGDFTDAGEQVFTNAPSQSTLVSGNFTVPVSALGGFTRMRVSMRYNVIPSSCQTFNFGEVEDYSIYIIDQNVLLYHNNTWDPNPPSDLTVADNALIYDNTYSIASDINLNDLQVRANANIEVDKAQSLTLNGDLLNNGVITMNSDSNEYSSLIVNGNVNGVVHYKRHANTTAATGGNDLISPPVSGQSFIDFIPANPNIVSNGTNTLYLFGPFDKLTGNYQIYSNTETAALEAGKGYRAASTNASTFTFRGFVNTSALNVPIFESGPSFQEWNLIGNPYPSYIKLVDFLAANSSQLAAPSVGIYGYDGDASDGWTIWNQAYSDLNPNAIITPGQGFFVASVSGGGNINFTPTMRIIGSDDDFILGRNTPNSISTIKLQLSRESSLYNTDFYFSDNASLVLDPGYDAVTFGDVAPSFSIFSQLVEDNQGKDLAIQAIHNDDITSDLAIPLGINANQGEQLTISIVNSTLDAGINVYLEDNLTNTFTLLNNSDYVFTPDSNLNGTGRFFMRFEAETLFINENPLSGLQIYNTKSPRELVVKGLIEKHTTLYLYDIQGRLVKSVDLNPSLTNQSVSLDNIEIGIYVVTLKNYTQTRSQKIIIR